MTTPIVFNHPLFLSTVLEALDGHDLEVEADGWAIKDNTIGASFGLVNLAQSIGDQPEDQWPELINEWVTRLLGVTPSDFETYEQAAPRLRVRLAADASKPGWGVYRNICDGLDEMLMLRNDVGCETVNREQVDAWEQPDERVWADARKHTMWDEPRERRIMARGTSRVVWVRHSFFASSVLVDLGSLLSPGNRHGAVVMVPCRDALLYAEMTSPQVAENTSAMMEVGTQWYVDGPGSLSPDVFWYRNDGRIERIAQAVGRHYESCWGQDFSRALAELESAAQRPAKRQPAKRKPAKRKP